MVKIILCIRWTFLCKANEGLEVRHHDGSIPDKIWQSAEWSSGAALSAGRRAVGVLHFAWPG